MTPPAFGSRRRRHFESLKRCCRGPSPSSEAICCTAIGRTRTVEWELCEVLGAKVCSAVKRARSRLRGGKPRLTLNSPWVELTVAHKPSLARQRVSAEVEGLGVAALTFENCARMKKANDCSLFVHNGDVSW
jgi:hypothetical protein